MYLILLVSVLVGVCYASIPIVVNTWNFPEAAQKGSDTMDMGAVGGLRRVKNVISVARHVLDYTEHSFLAGDLATEYAKTFVFPEESLQTNYSLGLWNNWKASNCQPNFRKNLVPNPKTQCGPYTVSDTLFDNSVSKDASGIGDSGNHDTIGMIVISESVRIAICGHYCITTSFINFRRVGDSPIAGAGAYADSDFGAAAATGNGDIMMRFLPSFLAVEQLRLGSSPGAAAKLAISRIAEKYPSFSGALIVVDKKGNVGIACNGMATFPYVIASEEYPNTILKTHNCTDSSSNSLENYSVKFYACAILLLSYYL
ncbi:hypothetical protein NQ314_010793 [Rhamnusium bicolor]|uniref:N(4)-(Beta-N-acetylglucosaminyl)-L-asparaginase n=1 Tax=Rhamnusium bicolor TaxID=1586634 RepID=A0AAV8XMW7_9CUCU|nr:hypothetical protein NQ314_010793 [Rhamnusium bicolor]